MILSWKEGSYRSACVLTTIGLIVICWTLGPIKVSAAELQGSVRVHADVRSYAKTTGISLLDALETAAERVHGPCVEAELEVEDGFLIYAFSFAASDGQKSGVIVDAGDGRILETEPNAALPTRSDRDWVICVFRSLTPSERQISSAQR